MKHQSSRGYILFALILFFASASCAQLRSIPGAERTAEYFSLIINKNIAIVANQTSVIGNTHIVDTLLSSGMKIKCVFAPEHGFRGEAEAGEVVNNSNDRKTGIPVISLYGSHKKPTHEDLKGVDIVLFDIQDVGARFYTYISTLQYVMESCAELKKPLLILDRPNPNGFYVDGPVLDTAFASFVGMNPIPVVHGLTIAEYALMLNGEHWLKNGISCELFYVKVSNWNHKILYDLPVPPSPNLPNMSSVYLYPSLCFFEGTDLSVGRGTEFPFQVIGKPGLKNGSFSFTPKSISGKSLKPLYEDQLCTGYDLREFGSQYMSSAGQLYIYWLLSLYKISDNKDKYFNSFFDKLAGNDMFRKQIVENIPEEEIRNSWQKDIESYKLIRKKYLLYEDFE
jgi:uncharacterized protein YbbC (DUF1343 family)